METWDERINWPVFPTGDGRTCHETFTTVVQRKMGLDSARILTPIYRDGYIYGYDEAGGIQLYRHAFPQTPILQKLWAVADRMYAGPLLGMNESKAVESLCKLVFELRGTRRLKPESKSFEFLTAAHLDSLLKACTRLKRLPPEIVTDLQELQGLLSLLTWE